MRKPSLKFMKTGNVRAYTETDGKHDKGVWEEWELWKYCKMWKHMKGKCGNGNGKAL